MKKILFISAVAALALAACTKDTVKEQNVDLDAIGFNPLTESTVTRATSYSSAEGGTDSLQTKTIYVEGYKSNAEKKYMSADLKYKKPESSTGTGIWDYSPKAYWPDKDTKLNFYAVAPKEAVTNENDIVITKASDEKNTTVVVKNFKVAEDHTQQADLVFAYKADEARDGSDTNPWSKVNLNFKHALSQVVFKGKLVNDDIEVIIKEIELVNVYGEGTGTFYPVASANNVTPTNKTDTVVWNSTGKTANAKYTVTLKDSVVVKKEENAVDLTSASNGNNVNLALLLLPQKQTSAWKTTFSSAIALPTSASDGAYLRIKCYFGNHFADVIGKATRDTDEETTIKNEAGSVTFDNVYIPFDSKVAWEANKRYVYTLNFGGAYDKNGNPILHPIEFDVTVDKWGENDVTNVIQAY